MQSYRTAQQAIGVIFEKYNLVYFSNAVEEFKEDALKKDAFLEILESYSRDNERMRDEINEFFATKLRRTKTMTREDLLQANAELTEEEIQALLGDQAKRSTKSAETERKKAEKKAEADRKKAEKKAEADRKKAEKKAEADRKKAEKKEEADRKKAEKKEEADRKKAEKKEEADRKKAEKTGKAGKNPAVNIVLESFAREEVKEAKGVNVMDMLEEVEFDFEDEIDVQKKEENEQTNVEENEQKTEEKAPKEKEKAPRKAKEEKVPKEKKERVPRKAKEAKEEKAKREKLPRKAKEAKEEVGQYVLTETEEYTMIEDTRTKTSYFLRDNKCFTEDRLVGKWCEDHIEFHNLKSDEVKKMTFKDILVDGDNLGQRTCYIDGNCVVYLNAAGDIWGTYCPKTNTIKEFIEEGDDCDVDCDEDAATQEPDEHMATQEPDEHPATQEPDDEDAVSQESQGANKTQHEEDYI